MEKETILTVEFEGVSFNATHFASYTKADFIAENMSNGLYSEFKRSDRVKLLGDAYGLILTKVAI